MLVQLERPEPLQAWRGSDGGHPTSSQGKATVQPGSGKSFPQGVFPPHFQLFVALVQLCGSLPSYPSSECIISTQHCDNKSFVYSLPPDLRQTSEVSTSYRSVFSCQPEFCSD